MRMTLAVHIVAGALALTFGYTALFAAFYWLWRVRIRRSSLIPFMFALFLVQQLSRKLIFEFLPIARTGTPPGSAINLVILSVTIVGLALSLWRRDNPEPVSALTG
jgi:hypothetical protein